MGSAVRARVTRRSGSAWARAGTELHRETHRHDGGRAVSRSGDVEIRTVGAPYGDTGVG